MKNLILLIAAFICDIVPSSAENIPANKPAEAYEVIVPEQNSSVSWYIKQDTFACTSEKAFDEMIRACNRKDQKALERLATYGSLAVLKKGTQIDMVKYGIAKCRVQVLSGTYQDIYFYVVTEHVDTR